MGIGLTGIGAGPKARDENRVLRNEDEDDMRMVELDMYKTNEYRVSSHSYNFLGGLSWEMKKALNSRSTFGYVQMCEGDFSSLLWAWGIPTLPNNIWQ